MKKQLPDYYLRAHIEYTDYGGVVYHANYLKFMEQARSEWLYLLGFDEQLLSQLQLGFAVRSADLNYRAPAKVGMRLRVETCIVEVRRASVSFAQKVLAENNNQLLCEGHITVVTVNQYFKPVAMPQLLLTHLTEEQSDA